jgi:Fe-S-cluster-containing hydrogenase component 2
MEGRHGFVFCTHGLMPGRFFARLVPIMVQRGLTVIGWNNWYCSVTMPEKPKPYFTDGHPDDIDLAEARAFGAQMAQRSRDVFSGQTQLVPRLPTGAAYDALYPGTGSTGLPGGGYPRPDLDPQRAEMLVNQNFEFKVNKERCQFPKCTLCIDNCPMQSINLAVTPPIFARNCDRCWFCEQICPRGAIEVDWAPLADVIQRTVFQRFAALAQEAERKGAFRRLVPIEKVGRETPWYTLKKQPRLKLP